MREAKRASAIGRGVSGALAMVLWLAASTAHGDGVGDMLVSVSLPPATVAVIDPESGTSSGTGTTDVRLSAGDVILFRLNYFSIPDQQIRGLAGYLTEFIPANTEVVGIRVIDAAGNTVLPRYPGIANDGCARSCPGFGSVLCNPALGLCTSGGTRDLADGAMAELHADTGFFYSSDPRVGRQPTTAFVSFGNGVLMSPAGTSVASIAPIFGASSPFFAHSDWDYIQVRALGISNSSGNASGNNGTGNTPFGYGSLVAGPNTGYRFEATLRGSRVELNDVVGPWNRLRSPGSLIGVGSAATGTGTLARMISDAATLGTDVTPATPLPLSTRAIRAALGEMRAGESGAIEIALRVLATPIDPVFGRDADCGEMAGSDTSGRSDTGRARDNPWGLFLPAPGCVYLNLLFDLTVDDTLAVTGDTLRYTLHGRNLSTLPQTGARAIQKYDATRISFVSATGSPTLMSNCEGDGLACVIWNLGTLDPSEDYVFNSVFSVGGGGHVTNVVSAVYRSTELPSGYTTQSVGLIRAVPVLHASLAPTVAFGSAGGTAAFSGTIRNDGSGDLSLDTLTFRLPSTSWRLPGPIVINGTSYTCSSGCATSEPKYTVGFSLTAGMVRTITGTVNVPAGAATAIHDVDLQVWASTMAFGGAFETYFPDVLRVPVGAPRSAPPVLDCPIFSSASGIRGTTSEADGTDVRAYFNLMERGVDTNATAGRFDVGTFGSGTGFGALYGGLEVRATATAPGELESDFSTPCFVTFVSQCQDGLDNDGDGLVDFPSDPGCSGPTDSSEVEPQCSNGLDDDGDGLRDFPADPECSAPEDQTEGGSPACSNGVDDDGDGAVDYPADSGCLSATDRTEVTRRACMDGIDNDGDGRVDFGGDSGCHSMNDASEADFAYPPGDIRARILLVFDTSGSMNSDVPGAFTGGDGSSACSGSGGSRIERARAGVAEVVAGYGEVEFSLMRYHQRASAFSCPTANASLASGGWQGGGAAPCGGGFSGGDLLVGFSPESSYDLLEWLDGSSNYVGSPPPGLDLELRGSGTTPIGGALDSARAALLAASAADPIGGSCRPYRVILLTDGLETCAGDPVASAAALSASGFPTSVIGFAVASPQLDAIAAAGGTGRAIFADDSAELSAAMADIVSDAILYETCNGADDDCDALVDEGFVRFCDRPSGVTSTSLCADPGERVCDGLDDNCDGRIDEGLRNACGACGPTPVELCNRADDDCDARIDEGGVCAGCSPEPESCNALDDDCDTRIDEGITRPCGTDVGACTSGTETCAAGVFGACTGIGATLESCNGIDDDCDGVIDGFSRPCGTGVGACEPGSETCTAGAFGVCVGAIGPSTELCNVADDDCDGSTDEGNPGGGGSCGSSLGICMPGSLTCVSGALTCVGGTSAGTETCDARDEDCDGPVDEGIPPAGTCGACGDGLMRCVAGAMACTGDRTPGSEVCNGIDDDCDDLVDEGDPGGGASCGDDTGECTSGTFHCTAGRLECVGSTGPVPEVCNALDDDCDGVVDDGLPVGAPCGTDRGECAPGRYVCVGGEITCDGAIDPIDESCNGLDDDCDGPIDEALPVGAECGSTEGVCVRGLLQCIGGSEVCVGEVPSRPESCDCVDDDCDGAVDEDPSALCGEGATCLASPDCQCALPCAYSEEFGVSCPLGSTASSADPETCFCVAPRCEDEACAEETVGTGETPDCAPGLDGVPVCVCRENRCTFPCDGVVCTTPTVCHPETGACVEDNCRGVGCPEGELCDPVLLTCLDDACLTADCAPEEACRYGICETSCADVICRAGEVCHSGLCVESLCVDVSCEAREVCNPEDGSCVDDECVGVRCPEGTLCEPLTGDCRGDRCGALHCPGDQVCHEGECAEPPPPDAGVRDAGVRADASGGIDAGVVDRESRVLASGGGGCLCAVPTGRGGGAGGAALVLGLVLVLGARRRRGVRAALTLAGGIAVCAATLGCQVEPYCLTCRDSVEDADGLDASVDASDARDPADVSVPLPDAAPFDAGCLEAELCNHRDDDCDDRSDEGIDMQTDPRNCGECGNACALLHAFAACVEGACALERCDVGWLDRDGDPENGCEYRCTSVADDDRVCDLRDDDCDGAIDEDVLVELDPANCGSCGRTCVTAHASSACTEGACALDACSEGYHDLDLSIANGCEYACVPATPPDEDCDARDDDCDGNVDEGDPGGGVSCGSDEGACMVGTTACMDGRVVCRDEIVPTTETCDGVDEDCDGTIDDGNPGAGARCGTGVGRCAPGVQTCAGGRLECVGGVGPTSETCDGTDEDCDGTTDDGDPGGGAACGDGAGECAPGAIHCRSGVLVCEGAVGPRPESCNARDDDCDTRVDEAFALATDVNNCGACGRVCAFANAVPTCNAGVCVLAACRSGFVNVDGTMSNGCEYACSYAGGEVCNGRDDDCDTRVDEGVSRPASFCNPNGVCAGTVASCSGVRGWTCPYPATYEASETRCDRLDNDCDGAIDEPFAGIEPVTGTGAACSVGSGACRRTGTFQCSSDGLGVSCSVATPGTPVAESCNAIDDDCNGIVDDNIPLASIPSVVVPRVGGGTVRVMSYEASRADATASSAGSASRVACSRAAVVPWTNVTWTEASAACCALNAGGVCTGSSGWRLCGAPDWETACEGPAGTCDWSYAASCTTSSMMTCNGEEYDCDSARAGDQDCLAATGSASFSSCRTSWAAAGNVYDLSGNAREWTSTAAGSGVYEVRGGSYESIESGRACDFDFTVASASSSAPNTGFRCCYYGP